MWYDATGKTTTTTTKAEKARHSRNIQYVCMIYKQHELKKKIERNPKSDFVMM